MLVALVELLSGDMVQSDDGSCESVMHLYRDSVSIFVLPNCFREAMTGIFLNSLYFGGLTRAKSDGLKDFISTNFEQGSLSL
jgi:hypothetical protein